MEKKKQNKEVEILAPAGTYEAFQAAVRSGADAVYAGGGLFGARAYAGNFDQETMIRAIQEAHLYGEKAVSYRQYPGEGAGDGGAALRLYRALL